MNTNPIPEKLKEKPPCLFELSVNGNCVGTVHDQCGNCEKRRQHNITETHEQAVKRYLDRPKHETDEERLARINRFRCGY